jgi:hypothetical protein
MAVAGMAMAAVAMAAGKFWYWAEQQSLLIPSAIWHAIAMSSVSIVLMGQTCHFDILVGLCLAEGTPPTT